MASPIERGVGQAGAALLLAFVVGCARETTSTVPVAVWGDVPRLVRAPGEPVYEEQTGPPELSMSSGRIAVLDFTGASTEDGAFQAELLRRQLRAEIGGRDIEGPFCGDRAPCFTILDHAETEALGVDPAAPTVVGPREAGVEHLIVGRFISPPGVTTLVELRVLKTADGTQAWGSRLEVADGLAIAQRLARAYLGRIERREVGVRYPTHYESRREVVGVEAQDITTLRFSPRFSFFGELGYRVEIDTRTLEPMVYLGMVFDDGALRHSILFGAGLTLPVWNCGEQVGGGTRVLYGLTGRLNEFYFIGAQVGLSFVYAVCEGETTFADTSVFELVSASLTTGAVVGPVEIGVQARFSGGFRTDPDGPNDDFGVGFSIGPQFQWVR
ncbi:MAG: hypothetical protein AAGF12_10540 [Myxococcota bacterium]